MSEAVCSLVTHSFYYSCKNVQRNTEMGCSKDEKVLEDDEKSVKVCRKELVNINISNLNNINTTTRL